MKKENILKTEFLKGLSEILGRNELNGIEKISEISEIDSLVELQMIVYIEQSTGELLSGAEIVKFETINDLLGRLNING